MKENESEIYKICDYKKIAKAKGDTKEYIKGYTRGVLLGLQLATKDQVELNLQKLGLNTEALNQINEILIKELNKINNAKDLV